MPWLDRCPFQDDIFFMFLGCHEFIFGFTQSRHVKDQNDNADKDCLREDKQSSHVFWHNKILGQKF